MSLSAQLSAKDLDLFHAIERKHKAKAAAAVQQAIRNGANVNAVRYGSTPLMNASHRGNTEIVGILLDAGADPRQRQHRNDFTAVATACWSGHLSTVQLLINHDKDLLEMADNRGETPLFKAVRQHHSDIVRFLLDSGADAHHANHYGWTALMCACETEGSNLEIVRLLLAASVDIEARDEHKKTALHHAARWGISEVMPELILQHNANMFAVDDNGCTPFDLVCGVHRSNPAVADPILEMYGNKLTQDHGRLALHKLLKVAKYSFVREVFFHPPLNPLEILLPLGELTLKHLRTLLHTLDPELIRNRDDTGKLPIHVACQTNAPVQVLALILELDQAVLHIADSTGALPIHWMCGTTTTAAEYASVRYLVEQGGVATLAARDRQGLLPLHVVSGSTNPPLLAVQYLIQSFPGSVAVQTNAGQYPFMVAACDSCSASLSVVYELVRAKPDLVIPR